jgi:hypothetical protein
MKSPNWFVSIPQPLRWGVGGALGLGAAGAIYGLVEAVRDYPVRSWFGVTLFLALIAILPGFVLGTVTGTIRLGAQRIRIWASR